MTPAEVKARLRLEGKTFSQWAREHGHSPQKVIRVLNGLDKGHYGRAHDIAVQFGLKPQSRTAATNN